MVARLQGLPDEWIVTGAKTAAYRQVGNAFPPPVAKAIGEAISDALVGRALKGGNRQVPLVAAGD
jgi:DNA (cytosine-5)-methyltransferase 1